MSGISRKFIKHAKEQENTALSKEKNKSMKTKPKMSQIIELVNKDIKTVIVKIFHMFKRVKIKHVK